MAKFVSHSSALICWNASLINLVPGLKTIDSVTVEYTVTSRSERYCKEGEKIHLCTAFLPYKSVVKKDGEIIASPELAFLQVANKLDIKALILLGLLLCSHPPGQPEKAITTKQKLVQFIEKAFWHRGRRKAMRAVKYIGDGCNSIMEAFAYMAIALPPLLGGYSLKGPVFNYEIKLNLKSMQMLNKRSCYADLYYKDSKIIVEYDSQTYHSSLTERGKDEVRAAALRRQGFTILSLTTIQLYNEYRFDLFVKYLAVLLGKRFRKKKTEKYIKIRQALRSMFPTKANK